MQTPKLSSDWLPNARIHDFLTDAAAGDTAAIRAFVAAGPLRATDLDCSCLVLVRDHDAWNIKGWHDANAPAEEGGQRLQMVNYYDEAFWSKLPVPVDDRIRAVRWDSGKFVFELTRREVRATPALLKSVILDSMTGIGLIDDRTMHNFLKLDGSVPLDSPPGENE